MARLNGQQFKTLKGALLDGFTTVPALEDLALGLGETLDMIGTGNSVPTRVNRMIGWASEQDRVDDLLKEALLLRASNLQLQRAKEVLQAVVELEETDHYRALVLKDGSVLVDRDVLREALRSLETVKTVIAVQGKPRSGASYSIELIRHLKQTGDFFEWAYVDLPYLPKNAAGAITPQDIGEAIASQLNLHRMPKPKGETDEAWVGRYWNWLAGQRLGKQNTYWIVIDSFRHVPLTAGARSLVVRLAQGTTTNVDNLRLVLLGYEPEYVDELQNTLGSSERNRFEREQIMDIDATVLGNFFVELYERRKMRQQLDYADEEVAALVTQVWNKVTPGKEEWLAALSEAVAQEARRIL